MPTKLEQLSLLAEALSTAGFITDITKHGVIVSLNRNISTMEVKIALGDLTDVCTVRAMNGKAIVTA